MAKSAHAPHAVAMSSLTSYSLVCSLSLIVSFSWLTLWLCCVEGQFWPLYFRKTAHCKLLGIWLPTCCSLGSRIRLFWACRRKSTWEILQESTNRLPQGRSTHCDGDKSGCQSLCLAHWYTLSCRQRAHPFKQFCKRMLSFNRMYSRVKFGHEQMSKLSVMSATDSIWHLVFACCSNLHQEHLGLLYQKTQTFFWKSPQLSMQDWPA